MPIQKFQHILKRHKIIVLISSESLLLVIHLSNKKCIILHLSSFNHYVDVFKSEVRENKKEKKNYNRDHIMHNLPSETVRRRQPLLTNCIQT